MTDPIGVAVVGYGYWGVNLARNVAVTLAGARLAAVVDGHADRRTLATENHPGLTVWDDLDRALESDDVHAIVLSVPAALHGSLGARVIEAGKHVLVEKPLAMTSAEGEKLIALAKTHDRVLMVGHTFLYSAPVLRLRQIIVDGELGEVQYLASQRLSLGRIRRDCNALWNFGPHDVSIMQFLLDEEPAEVSARGFSFIGDVEDVVFASVMFPSGVGANIHLSWIDPRKTRLTTVVGDEKMAVYDDVSADQKIAIVDAGVAGKREFGAYESLGDFQWRTRSGDILIPHIEMREPLRVEIEEFVECCATGRTPRTDGAHGLQVVRILEAIDESIRRRGRRAGGCSDVIHESALVAPDTKLGAQVTVGPFVTVGIEGDGSPTAVGPGCVLRSHSVVYRDVVFGASCQLGHGVLIREATRLGDNVSIGSHSVVEHHVEIGDGVRLHSNCFVPEHSVLEDDTWLGPGVIVTNARYPNRPDTKSNLEGVRVAAGATIGAGVVLLPGVVIGAGALVGAGTVVVRDVAPGARIIGNPGQELP